MNNASFPHTACSMCVVLSLGRVLREERGPVNGNDGELRSHSVYRDLFIQRGDRAPFYSHCSNLSTYLSIDWSTFPIKQARTKANVHKHFLL